MITFLILFQFHGTSILVCIYFKTLGVLQVFDPVEFIRY